MLSNEGQIQFSYEVSLFQTKNMHFLGKNPKMLMANKNHLNFHIKETSASFSNKQGQSCFWSFGIAACRLGKKLLEEKA